MSFLTAKITLATLLLLARQVTAIGFTLNSPCTSVCRDTSDPDPSTSRIKGSDITCRDSHYSSTTVGTKFQNCLSCLQTSNFVNGAENDQSWFIFNLRYGFDTCLFKFSNSTDAISTPCSTGKSCESLKNALETGDLNQSNENQYGYCTADGNAFRGSFFGKCKECLSQVDDEKYLANFLAALDAGCSQQPPPGTLIGMKGSIFSTTPVNATFPGDNALISTPTKKSMSQGTIIGIVVSIVFILLLIFSVTFLCLRKSRERRRQKELASPLDPRYGAPNITSPNDGAYGNPYTGLPVKSPDLNQATPNEQTRFNQPTLMFPLDHKREQEWKDSESQNSSIPPSYTSPKLPTHQAYIPTRSPGIGPISPISSSAGSIGRSREAYVPPATFGKRTQAHLSPISVANSSQQNSPQPREVGPSEIQIGSQQQRTSPPVSPPARPQSRTKMRGVGNVNASKDEGTRGSRIDFEIAERERKVKEAREGRSLLGGNRGEKIQGMWSSSKGVKKGKREERTPDSADSEEQWPGSY
ncbi:hypothetical protein BGZ60DRAFT_212411 [Tricladium varicosporioides]|nr:hypothetical protein BGZ60DRAFT_212411 [Hymenoscyphus varicosporioides]